MIGRANGQAILNKINNNKKELIKRIKSNDLHIRQKQQYGKKISPPNFWGTDFLIKLQGIESYIILGLPTLMTKESYHLLMTSKIFYALGYCLTV